MTRQSIATLRYLIKIWKQFCLLFDTLSFALFNVYINIKLSCFPAYIVFLFLLLEGGWRLNHDYPIKVHGGQ